MMPHYRSGTDIMFVVNKYSELYCNDIDVQINSCMFNICTPPHLMKYAKLILILIKQLVSLNVLDLIMRYSV